MLEIRSFRRAESLEEAWELNQKKTNRVIGGMLWLKMSHGRCGTAIDLSGLGLDRIEEDDEAFRIGCMATLRQLEMHPALNAYSCGAVRDAVKSIVGVQFRNLATAGVTNCEVLAAAPFQVSGTGALTGALMAYENLSGVTLDSSKNEE